MHGSGWFGSGWVTKLSVLGGRVGSGPMSKISNKYTIYTQETDYSTAIIVKIKSCNVAIYLCLIIYSSIKDVLFGEKTAACETTMLSSELKSDLVDKLKDSAADGKTISRA